MFTGQQSSRKGLSPFHRKKPESFRFIFYKSLKFKNPPDVDDSHKNPATCGGFFSYFAAFPDRSGSIRGLTNEKNCVKYLFVSIILHFYYKR